jgi:hypothetical protein
VASLEMKYLIALNKWDDHLSPFPKLVFFICLFLGAAIINALLGWRPHVVTTVVCVSYVLQRIAYILEYIKER